MGDPEDGTKNGPREDGYDSANISLAGSMKLDKRTGRVIRDLLSTDSLNIRLASISEANNKRELHEKVSKISLNDIEKSGQDRLSLADTKPSTNLQIILLRLLIKEDFRLIKYLVLYVMIGFMTSPFNFLFMSIEETTKVRVEYKFSELAGYLCIAQGMAESFGFFILPYLAKCSTNLRRVVFVLIGLSGRALYYGTYYYSSGSLYWAMVSESVLGISYAVYALLMADLSVMFSRQSVMFIPKLRELGILSDPEVVGRKKSLEEEAQVSVALRATIQASFGGAIEGLGLGVGSLVCGIVYDSLGYIDMWRLVAGVGLVTLLLYLICDLTKSRYSDSCSRYKSGQPTAVMNDSQVNV